MAAQDSAIKSYLNKLPGELSKRYGGSGPYTEGQLKTTIEELRLNDRYIRYAFLMFCSEEVVASQGVDSDAVVQMTNEISKVSESGGIAAAPLGALFGSGEGDAGGFGFGDGGGGGE